MKKYIYILIALFPLLTVSCKVDEIDTYSLENSAVVFRTRSVQFSMKGVTEEYITKKITLDLVGVIADYDRRIDIRVSTSDDNTAVEGVDFIIEDAVLKAGQYVAELDFRIHDLPNGVESQNVTIEIVPNEYFRKGYPETSQTIVSWSEEYVRPSALPVWRWWHTFFCPGYSKNYHKILVEVLGEEVEVTTQTASAAREDPTLIYKVSSWWYGANAKVRQYVLDYDRAHPDAPLMHSDDYEQYSGYSLGVGEGVKPERIPTIYETLRVI